MRKRRMRRKSPRKIQKKRNRKLNNYRVSRGGIRL